MLGDRQAAEDVVQDAFAGLYRRWGGLADHGKALHYLRACVVNGCRTARRRRTWPVLDLTDLDPAAVSAEAAPLAPGGMSPPCHPEAAVLAVERQRAMMHWAPIFVQCARPAVTVMERLQLSRHSRHSRGACGT